MWGCRIAGREQVHIPEYMRPTDQPPPVIANVWMEGSNSTRQSKVSQRHLRADVGVPGFTETNADSVQSK